MFDLKLTFCYCNN